MGAAGTSCTDAHIDPSKTKKGGEVHRYGGVHCTEDCPRAYKGGIALLAYLVIGQYHRFGYTVIPVEDTHFLVLEKVRVYTSLREGFHGSHISIFALFSHGDTLPPPQYALELGGRHIASQGRTITVCLALRIKDDPRFPFI